MKNILLFLLCFSNLIIAQQTDGINITTNNSTTQDEYNFISNNGLKRFMEEGGDMKLNYRLVKFFNQNIDDKYNFEYYSFYKTSGGDEGFKAIAVVIKSKITKRTFYLCIPLNNNDLSDRHWQSVLNFSDDLAKAYSYSTGIAMVKFASFHFNNK